MESSRVFDQEGGQGVKGVLAIAGDGPSKDISRVREVF